MSPLVFQILGFFLLLFPLWTLRARGARMGGFEHRVWPGGRNLVLAICDVLRAAAGAGLLVRMPVDLPVLDGLGVWGNPLVVGVAVALGFAVQTLVWRDDDHAFAPVAFGLGVAATAMHPLVLAIALPLAIGTAIAVRAWAAGFIAAGVGLVGVGLAVEQQDWRLGLFVGTAFFVPVLISLMAGRHLGWPRK
jgi:hypothetical protein